MSRGLGDVYKRQPQDRAFDIDLTQNRWKLQSTEDFPGHSHENVTMEVYVR